MQTVEWDPSHLGLGHSGSPKDCPSETTGKNTEVGTSLPATSGSAQFVFWGFDVSFLDLY